MLDIQTLHAQSGVSVSLQYKVALVLDHVKKILGMQHLRFTYGLRYVGYDAECLVILSPVNPQPLLENEDFTRCVYLDELEGIWITINPYLLGIEFDVEIPMEEFFATHYIEGDEEKRCN